MKRTLITMMLLVGIVPTSALDGELAGDRFPFVVQFNSTQEDGSVVGCTGTVIDNGIIITASHCITNPKIKDSKCAADFFADRLRGTCEISEGYARFVEIHYKDKYGFEQSTKTTAYVWPNQYSTWHLYWERTRRNPNSSGPDIEDAFTKSNFLDSAILRPREFIPLRAYGHIIWDVFGPVLQDMKNMNDWTITDSRKTAIERIFETRFGKGPYEAVLVGYGLSGPYAACQTKQPACISDHRRRYATVPIIPAPSIIKSITFTGDKNLKPTSVTIPLRPPWLWTAGTVNGENPARPGDSGGPMFVKAVDGKWYLVAMTSGSGGSDSSHASPLIVPKLWQGIL
jgi:hypothetical protein